MDINNFKETYGFLTDLERARSISELLGHIDEQAARIKILTARLELATSALKHCSDNTNPCREETAQRALEDIEYPSGY